MEFFVKYVSLIFALNIPCKLDTFGDWHMFALNWDNVKLLESTGSLWGDYGIEKSKDIPYHDGKYNVANHIRALLDLLYYQKFTVAQGMKDDFMCTDKYDEEVFGKVLMMKDLPYWDKIDKFMTKEYLGKWVNFTKNGQMSEM